MMNYELRRSRREKIEVFRKERFDSVYSAAESALRTAFLVNGGGAVALFAFLGQATKQNQAWINFHLFSLAMLILVLGVALAAIATGVSFLAQYGYFMRQGRSKFGKIARRLTVLNICLVAGSHIGFVTAGIVAYAALP